MPTSNNPASVLVVDDEPDLRTLYELTLLREGHAVVAAADLAQAREWLAQQRFDVLISDMRLPDGLGLELLRELTEAQRTEKCIVITAFGSADNAVESLKAGAFDYLTKPVDLKQLRNAVTQAVQSQRHPLMGHQGRAGNRGVGADEILREQNDPGSFAAREQALAFNPELIVLVAPDHYNGFFNELMPPFCVGTQAHSVGDYLTPPGDLKVDGTAAEAMVHSLMEADFDVALSRRMQQAGGNGGLAHIGIGAGNEVGSVHSVSRGQRLVQ